MIRITHGTFGWYDGRFVRPMTRASGPFEADKELEARLVAKGMAEYVDQPDEPEKEPEPEKPEESEEDLADMTKAELEELAKSLGVPVGKKTKAQLIAAIEEADEPLAMDAAEVE